MSDLEIERPVLDPDQEGFGQRETGSEQGEPFPVSCRINGCQVGPVKEGLESNPTFEKILAEGRKPWAV